MKNENLTVKNDEKIQKIILTLKVIKSEQMTNEG